MLRFLTAGESHGQALVITVDGMPAGLQIDLDALNAQLRRRQGGYGRGRRMQIESDTAEVIAGVRRGRTTGNDAGAPASGFTAGDAISLIVGSAAYAARFWLHPWLIGVPII